MKTEKELNRKAEKYTKKECEDVKEAMVYQPSDIKHLVKEVYKEGYRQCEKDYEKWRTDSINAQQDW